jgi:steroid delta-isomerase-like uncharacterized protein
MTTADQNEERLKRLYDNVWNGEDLDVVDDLVGAEYVIHDREIAEELGGPELYKALVRMTREIFPDMAFSLEDVIAADDRVVVRWTMTGTHEGPMSGVEPTGRAVSLSAIEINRFEEGKLVETWIQSDILGLLQQLGAVPVSEDGEPE